jgi:hypothetical protein
MQEAKLTAETREGKPSYGGITPESIENKEEDKTRAHPTRKDLLQPDRSTSSADSGAVCQEVVGKNV